MTTQDLYATVTNQIVTALESRAIPSPLGLPLAENRRRIPTPTQRHPISRHVMFIVVMDGGRRQRLRQPLLHDLSASQANTAACVRKGERSTPVLCSASP